jgi:hypothetical protein
MNAADAINAATYALRAIEKIAQGEEINGTFWSEEEPEARLEEIHDRARDVLVELAEAGFKTEHNL